MKLPTRLSTYDKPAVRYLLVGGVNTLVGYGLFCGLHALLRLVAVPRPHLVASVAGNVLAIMVAFLGYKYLVFRSRGPFWSECLRCYAVYGATALLGLGLLALGVDLLGINPYLAQLLVTGVTVAASYLGHKHLTFVPPPFQACGDATVGKETMDGHIH